MRVIPNQTSQHLTDLIADVLREPEFENPTTWTDEEWRRSLTSDYVASLDADVLAPELTRLMPPTYNPEGDDILREEIRAVLRNRREQLKLS